MQYLIMALIPAVALVGLYSAHDLNELRGYPDAQQSIELKYNCDTPENLAVMIRDLDDDMIEALCSLEE